MQAKLNTYLILGYLLRLVLMLITVTMPYAVIVIVALVNIAMMTVGEGKEGNRWFKISVRYISIIPGILQTSSGYFSHYF